MHFKSVTYVSLYNATSVLVIQCACSVREEKYLNGKIIKTGLLKWLTLKLNTFNFPKTHIKENVKSNFMLKHEIHLVTLSGDLCAAVC